MVTYIDRSIDRERETFIMRSFLDVIVTHFRKEEKKERREKDRKKVRQAMERKRKQRYSEKEVDILIEKSYGECRTAFCLV